MGNTSCCCSCSPSQQDYQDVINHLEVVQEISHIDELISYIDQLLNAIDQGRVNSTAGLSKTNRVGSSINSAGGLLEKVLKRSHSHVCKRDIVPNLNRETGKLAIDITKQAAHIQWVGIALSVVSFVLERIEQVSSNRDECIQLLRYMCNLAKYIKQLDDHLAQEKLNRIIRFIVEGSLLCISQMQSHALSKFFAAPVAADDLRRLQAELGHEYSELTLEAVIAVLNRSAEVLNRIPVVLPPSQGTYPQAVGIEEVKYRVTELLDMKSQSIKAVVIYGQGGIGKTTLATAIFNKLDLQNYKFCRVDIEQNCSEADLKLLQQQILKDLYARYIQLRNLNEGREVLSKDFKECSSKPVFIFLDNALRESDLEKLLPISDLAFLPAQSRILLTTRNLNETQIIRQAKIEFLYYRVASLQQEDARKLFCEFALENDQTSFDATIDVEGLLQICQGIPLVLKIAGANLRAHAQNIQTLRDTVEYLKTWLLQGAENELSERMVDFVYNQLKPSCKEVFLDIVFFFTNWKRDQVAYTVGETEFEELERAALVNVTNGKVNVHDIVKARGRMLSSIDGERITDLQSLSDVLDDEERIKKTKGIALDWESFELEGRRLNLMKRSLRVLILTGSTKIVNGECKGTFENLRLLKIDSFNHSFMDVNKHRRLAGFILSPGGCIEFDEFAGIFPSSLKYMYIEGATLVNLTTTLSQIQSLRSLTLRSCIGFDSLPDSFCNLSSLNELDLRLCSSLVSLPDSFGNLYGLVNLNLNKCSHLSVLPESFGNLASLECLVLYHCQKLSNLPRNFGQLKCLKFVSIHGCRALQSLSDDFECLSSLIAVKASECPQLEENTMDKLAKVKGLMIVDIYRSPLLKERWEQVKGQYSLAVLEYGLLGEMYEIEYPYEDVMCRAFLHSESKFVHVDDNGQLVESPSPADGVKLWLLLKECDVNVRYSASSSSNSRCWESVKKKWEELVGSEGGQIIYVDMGGSWEERETRVQQALPHLPNGTCAWIAPDNRARLSFAYSVQHYYTKHFAVSREAEKGVENCIVSTSICVDEEERRRLDDLKFILPDLPNTPPFEKTDYKNFSDQLLSPIVEARRFVFPSLTISFIVSF
ncbi:disease resistance protein RUN1 [Cryptomeria japonica]|uniref:disease resistance protein RUN1 n=1 Tax=Cryptomeria japonica TaxID=3369 RepID=UPI0027D9DE6E|nr:disease resistance protein RUN1 [Cryptomeria japonica]